MCYLVEAEVGRAGGDFKQASSLLVSLRWDNERYLPQINFGRCLVAHWVQQAHAVFRAHQKT